ncbi:MAG: SulP family inorganic anion transporter [Gammaproteobacteria bacterium]|nr:SulP family inorganic anion transporter [Gammaproteobacteria bacterium]
MLRKVFRYPSGYLKYDLVAGLVVFLVAIPLCLGVALASGAPLFSGIIAGIIGGIVVGILSESRLSVSGPAAGMVAVVLSAISQLGGFETFLLALLLAGILQIIIGSLRAGFIADYIPSNVIQGLLCAIGILIIVKQIPFAFTYTTENVLLLEAFRDTSNTLSLKPLEDITDHINLGAVIISTLSLGLLIFFDKTSNPRFKKIPGSIVVVILGIIINEIYATFLPDIAQYSTELVNIPLSDNFQSFCALFKHPNWQSWSDPNVYFYACVLAAIASLEALLNLEAIEKLDNIKRYVSRNRELVAQGIGNTLAGLLGGIPITSVIVRSSVNIQAGAKSKLSTIIHGVFILLVAILIPHWMNLIPLASLAAILIYVGYKLTKPYIYKEMYEQGFARFLPFIITVAAIIFTNLLTGILIGLFFSFFFILRDNSQVQLDIINEKHPLGVIKRIVLPQQMSFLSKASFVAELEHIPSDIHLIIDARYTKYIDRDILEVLEDFKNSKAPNKNIAINLLGFKDHYDIHNHIDFINVTTYDMQSALKPADVLEILKEGNKRFVNDQRIHRSVLDDIKSTSSTQHPIAIVLGCIDSRVPIETIFDMGVGDVFVVRIAGNVMNDDIIASMEFACHIAGAKFILVLGHTQCGAIKAACDGAVSGHLGHLLDKIKPAINAEIATQTNRTVDNENFLTNVTKINIENTIREIHAKSTVLNRLITTHEIGLIGALYDVGTGLVSFQE